MAIIGSVSATVLVFVFAGCSSDSGSSPATSAATNAPIEIHTAATVVGITAIPDVAGTAGGSASINTGSGSPGSIGAPVGTGAAPVPEVAVRTLVKSGTFDCTATGTYQPFADVQITIQVGEPASGATCADTVIDLPAGFCSTKACSSIPTDWVVVQKKGVEPQSLLLVVAPRDTHIGQFLCVKDFVPQPKQILPVATTIEQACTPATADSIEIPYVPPATSDIPFVPPPASADIIPAG